MEIELFVSASFAPCRDAEQAWRAAATKYKNTFTVLDVNGSGRKRARALGVKVVPALAVNGTLRAVGVQSTEEASRLLALFSDEQAPA